MGKVIDCNQVAPEAGCDHVVRGAICAGWDCPTECVTGRDLRVRD